MILTGKYTLPNNSVNQPSTTVENPSIELMGEEIDKLNFVNNHFQIWLRITTLGSSFDYLLENIPVEQLQFNGVESLMSIIAAKINTFKID